MEETIVFLTGVVKFVPKDTVVSINDKLFTVGPGGVSHIPSEHPVLPKYIVSYETPMQKDWKSIAAHMKSGKMTIRQRDCDKNIGQTLIKMISAVM